MSKPPDSKLCYMLFTSQRISSHYRKCLQICTYWLDSGFWKREAVLSVRGIQHQPILHTSGPPPKKIGHIKQHDSNRIGKK